MRQLCHVACLTLCLAGCAAWHYSSLPSRGEFAQPLDTLIRDYPELRSCEPTFGRMLITPISDMPYAQDLIEQWGEPDHRRPSWWNLTILGTVIPPFHPLSVWKWEIEDKTVVCRIDHPLAYGYESHVWTLKVVED